MHQYHTLLRHILNNGVERGDRTGVGTIGVFGYQARFDLREGFPLVTTKKMFWRGIVAELLWFLSGSTNEHVLRDQGVNIWKEWATAEQCGRFGREAGDLGPVYGHQWRNFGGTHCDDLRDDLRRLAGPDGYHQNGFDQIAWLLDELQKNPNSRRLVLSSWHAAEAQVVTLPACHTVAQFYVQDGALSCHLYMRSCDAFLGLPFNIATYALLTHLMALVTGLGVRDLVVSFGDLHIYQNHLAQVHEQLSRKCRDLPYVSLTTPTVPDGLNHALRCLLAFRAEDIDLFGYDAHPAIKAPVAV